MPRTRFRRRRRGYRSSKLKRQVYKNKAKLRRIGGIERKAKAVVTTNNDVNTTGGILYINPLLQGDDYNERIGSDVMIKSIMIRGFLHNDHGTPSDGQCRILLVYDAMNQQANPAITDILDAANVNSMQNWLQKGRFKIYYDQTFTFDTTQHSLIPFKIRVSKINRKAVYVANNNTVADAQKGHWFLVFFGTVIGTTDDPLLDVTYRFTYDDA